DDTSARSASSIAMPSRPNVASLSTTAGGENVSPASLEKATFTFAVPPATVNQATAAARPEAATTGPLTGHALICHLSSNTVDGVVHLPLTSRAVEMSRTS